MEGFMGFILGVIATAFALGLSLGCSDVLHRDHVYKYNECVKIGAPVQNCIDTYLLDKKP